MNTSGPHPQPSDGQPRNGDVARPATASDPGPSPDPAERRRAAARAGHEGDLVAAHAFAADPDPLVRATALGAVSRIGALDALTRAAAAADPDHRVRRRLAEELGRSAGEAPPDVDAVALLIELLDDPEPLTAEAAAWALGEVAEGRDGVPREATAAVAVSALITAATHDDPLVREAAVAALGAIGDPRGLPTVLAGTTDKPAIRRRAVLALAPFLGEPGVDDALERATTDRDWQVRQAADLLRRPDP